MSVLIDADAVIEVQMYDEEHEDFYTEKMTVEDYICMYSEMPPTIDAVPVKRGMWTFIRLTNKDYGHKAKECSSCGSTFFDTKQWNYCPNCGADMRGTEDGDK